MMKPLTALLLLIVLHAAASMRLNVNRGTMVWSACTFGFTRLKLLPAYGASQTRQLLVEARNQLQPCAEQIEDGNWDGVRNVIKTAPLANVRNLITKYIQETEADDLIGPREDLVQSLAMLDMTVYNNIFVNEELGMGKKGAGVKVDRSTPLGHLSDSKKLLDEVLAIE